LYTTLGVVACIGFAVAVWDLTMGGFYFRVLGVRLSSWEVYKPFRIGMVAIVAAIALTHRRREGLRYQDISAQVAVRREDRVRIVKMPSEPKA